MVGHVLEPPGITVARRSPVLPSHSVTCPSIPELATVSPCGEYATRWTHPPCAFVGGRTHWLERRSITPTSPVVAPIASRVLSGERSIHAGSTPSSPFTT